jgi:uncharacterized protein YggE
MPACQMTRLYGVHSATIQNDINNSGSSTTKTFLMMKKNLLYAFSCAFMLFCTQSAAQVMGNAKYQSQQYFQQSGNGGTGQQPITSANIANHNEMVITVNGLANVLANQYVAVFNVIQIAETMEDAVRLMEQRIDTLRFKLAGTDIADSDIHVDLISFVPRYDIQVESRLFSKNYNEIPAGFELQQNITVKYKSSSLLTKIITAAAKAEIYDIVKVDYFLEDIQLSIDSLRRGCLREIVAREKNLAIIGIRADTLRKVVADHFTTVYPPSRYYSYQAFSRPSFSAVKRKFSAQPVLNEEQKTNSRYYQHVLYDQYDIVRNPVITEPVVQISYTVTVKYFLKNEVVPATPPAKHYFITANGELKQLELK